MRVILQAQLLFFFIQPLSRSFFFLAIFFFYWCQYSTLFGFLCVLHILVHMKIDIMIISIQGIFSNMGRWNLSILNANFSCSTCAKCHDLNNRFLFFIIIVSHLTWFSGDFGPKLNVLTKLKCAERLNIFALSPSIGHNAWLRGKQIPWDS